MTYLAGIHDLAYIFTRVGASADAGARQDWVSLGANIAGGAGKFVWYKKSQGLLKTTLEKVGKQVLPTPTAIIDVTIVVVAVVDLLNGFGTPENGSKFASGVDKLKVVDAKLELAIPDSRDWDGDAASAYTQQLEALRALVAAMQELDKQMKTIVGSQGDEIYQAHRTLAILGFALVAAQGIAIALYLIPVAGPELSMLFQVVAALAAATTVTVQETLALSNSFNAASAAEAVTADYIALGKRGELGGTFATIKVAEAEETRVGSFEAISNGLSAFSATPTVASLANLAGDDGRVFEERRALVSALTADEPPADDSPAPAPETSDDGTTPRFTLPTMAQLSQVTGQVAKISKDVAQPLNVVNQTMGSAQQVVSMAQSMAQQGQDSAAPADEPTHEEATLARDVEDVDGVGAASGAEAGERAPIDAAAAESEPAEEQGRAQRTL